MKIEQSPLTVLAMCNACGWRTTMPTPASAWTALARHAKLQHNDTRAAARARDAARAHRRRASKS